MSNFLKQMADLSMARAEHLPHKYDAIKLDRPSFDLQFSNFDIIAEYKANSPAEGRLVKKNLTKIERILAYINGGAAAISVLTEPTRFDGNLSDLVEIVDAVSHLSMPIMRKDFLVDPRQIMESKASGASGILLIAALFKPLQLRSMLDCAHEHSLFVLLESFDRDDVIKSKSLLTESRYRAMTSQKKLLFGINTRDLKTLKVESQRLHLLANEMPHEATLVAESGLHDVQDILKARQDGYSMALIGTALMRANAPDKLIQELLLTGRSFGQ